jgi:hypothetical protein
MRSNKKGYGSKTHYTDSRNRNTIAPSGRELYHLQSSFQAASPETFGYTLILPEYITACIQHEQLPYYISSVRFILVYYKLRINLSSLGRILDKQQLYD